ncbi:hypothetical protein ACQR1N_19890 [Bradyrhizobium sp. HKCCYLRH1073]|uniref:hypothetical protein n=1 Tax=unclassified Bradyrhizobium TaxID=2631580 RepID=UPI0028EB8256|nr:MULTISPECIES: hypothetical protein [unclassified Bradyrhizobium]
MSDTATAHPQQAGIFRARGLNSSERILADLGEKAFLNLWSYPNLFYNKKQRDKGDGKELCDLLAVCGDDIIIFSDKVIQWSEGKEVKVAWPRFYRRAVQASVDQINGAARIIADFPEKIFTDSACTQKFPISLPPVETRRVHGVIIASGCHKVIQEQLQDESGSFLIMPMLKGAQHMDPNTEGYLPFGIGDVNPDGMFIHVFDDVSIKRILEHLDTVSDFTEYLNKRATYLRSGMLLIAHGEEEMLGRYLAIGMATGDPQFETKRKKKDMKALSTTIQGEWSAYLWSDGYFAKTLADEKSKVWDKIIGLFSGNVIAGTSVSILGDMPSPELSERGLRFMALENRFSRRVLGEAILDALTKAEQLRQDRFTRVMMPNNASADDKLAYILMIVAYPVELEKAGGLEGGYAQYRLGRLHQLEAYCMNVLQEHRNLKTAVGIAIDASSLQTGQRGGSEDLIAVEVDEWTDELIAETKAKQEKFDVFRKDRLQITEMRRNEYPVTEAQSAK